MKKFIAALMSVILVIATCAFAACTPDKSIGVVEGNYVETDAEGLSAALSNVKTDSVDIENGVGFDMATKIAFSLDIPEMGTMSASGDFGYKINAKTNGVDLTLAGAGSGSVSYTLISDNTKVEEKYSANVYNDSQYLYLDTTATDKGKIDFVKLIEDAMQGGLPDIGGGDVSLPETGTTDISEMLGMLESLGIKTYIDTNNGLKIKLSIDANTFKTLLIGAIEAYKDQLPSDVATTVLGMLALVEFSEFNIDFYLVFDAEGKFVQFGEDINIKASVQLPAASGISGTVTLSLSNSSYLKAYSGTVTLPDDLESYPDMTNQIPAVGV